MIFRIIIQNVTMIFLDLSGSNVIAEIIICIRELVTIFLLFSMTRAE
jgi:hypothetical protein